MTMTWSPIRLSLGLVRTLGTRNWLGHASYHLYMTTWVMSLVKRHWPSHEPVATIGHTPEAIYMNISLRIPGRANHCRLGWSRLAALANKTKQRTALEWPHGNIKKKPWLEEMRSRGWGEDITLYVSYVWYVINNYHQEMSVIKNYLQSRRFFWNRRFNSWDICKNRIN